MSVTPQTNTDLPALARILGERDNFVICGHVSPDGDCIGSQLALMFALRLLGKTATCLLAKDEPIDVRLTFLPGSDEFIPAAAFQGVPSTFIAVDVPLKERMNSAAGHILDACEFSVTIDHHAVDERMTDLAYVDPAIASTTMLIWELAGLLGVERDARIAQCCYTGLVTDTGRFQYQNTDAPALAAAAQMVEAGATPADVSRHIFQSRSLPSIELEALAIERMHLGAHGAYALSWIEQADYARTGAVKADGEPLIDVLRSLRGVRVACMLRDQGDSVRGSFRAKDDTDVAALARTLGGGGHRAAAGFTVSGPMVAAVARIEDLLTEMLEESADSSAQNTGEHAS
ncbi:MULTISPECIES: DHH family phosphoesterase [Gordonibacter]|uniref:DHH family phosphoesterase n=1 Tax=Gordonibacter faecis TaxID=3047475 RepID=A0ABT7DIT9_9ACTN|nr:MULTISPECIES: DHH family phosphoesterase [unclassified Gordonibacter]MDJ1649439.1 DHH family phosphoesterase [Gordonibacter sp. KGMB12511]HIW75097.1 DHH family phosphoesterase [Candidatus Gordonibacter avicola]